MRFQSLSSIIYSCINSILLVGIDSMCLIKSTDSRPLIYAGKKASLEGGLESRLSKPMTAL